MSYLTIKFDVINQIIYYLEENEIVADSLQYLYAQFSFTGDWINPIYALFYTGVGSTPVQIQLDNDNGCLVPAEMIKPPHFYVSLYCGGKIKLITTKKQKVNVKPSGYSDKPVPPMPPYPAQLFVRTPEGDKQILELRENDGHFEYTTDGENWKRIETGTGSADGDFVEKKPGNANDIQFDDGDTFQQKYDAGELKGNDGAKGDKGDKGADAVLLVKEGADFTTDDLPEGAWGGVYYA